MKRIISSILSVVILISMPMNSHAANTEEEYYTVQVEYSDNIGHKETLNVMILNNNVFVDAKMLAERLGYTFGENGESAVIFNKDMSNCLPIGITQFNYNSTRVSHMLFNNMIDTYEAPFASIKNSRGSWIPLEFSLMLINSSMMIADDVLLIDMPSKRIIDYFYDIFKNSDKYSFDWEDDFGYTETDLNVIGGFSHMVNVLNGLLVFDGASWATLFQQFAGNTDSYDKKYGENLAMLLCTESDKELKASIDKVNMMVDVLDEDGKLGQMLSSTSIMLEAQIETLYKNCDDILKKVKSENSPLVSYSRSYQAWEDALDRQTWFSNTGENILEIQKDVSSAAGKALTFLDVGMKVMEVVGYVQEFQNQDKFSLAALMYYLDKENGGLDLPVEMKKTMIDYSSTLSNSVNEYTTKRFSENVDGWIIDKIPLHEVLGTQAAARLFAWNIASNTIPFIENGLSGADSFEVALYSLVFQEDAFLNYLCKRDSIFDDSSKITAENMYDLSQYCYIYLKSCYTTRETALASLVNKSSSTQENIQSLIDYQNSINSEIAEILVELKGANNTNNYYVFGFLPSDNEEYINKYDDKNLISWINNNALYYDNIIAQEKYTQVVEDAIIETLYGRANGSCFLYDIDNDGVDELVIVNVCNKLGENGMFPGYVYSIYDFENGEITPKCDKNLLFCEAGGPSGYVGVANYLDTNVVLVYTDNGETGYQAHRESQYEIYNPKNFDLIISARLDYQLDDDNTVKVNSCKVDNKSCDYKEYLEVVNSIKPIIFAEAGLNDESDGSMTMYEMLHFIQEAVGIIPDSSPQITKIDAEQIANSFWNEYLRREQGVDWKVFAEESLIKEGVEYYCFTLQNNSKYGENDWVVSKYLFVNSLTGEYSNSLYDNLS